MPAPVHKLSRDMRMSTKSTCSRCYRRHGALRRPVEQFDCPAVAALRAAGAVLVGVTNMPELGMSPVGLNQHYGSPRNPWHFAHLCGGSSSGPWCCTFLCSKLYGSTVHSRVYTSQETVRVCASPLMCETAEASAEMCAGSAALVGCGIVPFALGNDAGGSIRVPASCCGAVGLFPTHSRVPSQAGTKHCKTTVMSDGPIAGTAADAALVYAVMAARPSGSERGARASVLLLFVSFRSTVSEWRDVESLCKHVIQFQIAVEGSVGDHRCKGIGGADRNRGRVQVLMSWLSVHHLHWAALRQACHCTCRSCRGRTRRG